MAMYSLPSSLRRSWAASISGLPTVFCVASSISTGVIRAKSDTRSWGRNWQRLSSWTLNWFIIFDTIYAEKENTQLHCSLSCKNRKNTCGSPASETVVGRPLTNHVWSLYARLINRLRWMIMFVGPLSSTSMEAWLHPCFTKSLRWPARPRNLGSPPNPKHRALTRVLLPQPFGAMMRFKAGPKWMVKSE